jgi:hypothetical protein
MRTIPQAIQRFRAYLQRRNYAAHMVDGYLLDLHLFFGDLDRPLDTISFHDVDQFIDQQYVQGLACPCQ